MCVVVARRWVGEWCGGRRQILLSASVRCGEGTREYVRGLGRNVGEAVLEWVGTSKPHLHKPLDYVHAVITAVSNARE